MRRSSSSEVSLATARMQSRTFLGRVQPPGQRESRQQRMAHPAPRAPQPGHEDLPAAARLPDITPVPRPEHQQPGTQRAGRAREPDVTAGCRVRIDRKRARPYDGHGRHRLGSLLAVGAKRGEEGSLTFNGDTTILTRQQQAGKRHRQRARPGTRPPAQRSELTRVGSWLHPDAQGAAGPLRSLTLLKKVKDILAASLRLEATGRNPTGKDPRERMGELGDSGFIVFTVDDDAELVRVYGLVWIG